MKIKPGVILTPALAMSCAVTIANDIWIDNGQEIVITSNLDGTHGKKSMHNLGLGLDFRTHYFDTKTKHKVARELRDSLGQGFVVVVHKTHIHIEYRGIR